jgi:hypothetical protein
MILDLGEIIVNTSVNLTFRQGMAYHSDMNSNLRNLFACASQSSAPWNMGRSNALYWLNESNYFNLENCDTNSKR